MAKHVTRRSYKKRASKKRRTIRKLKRTMRRKMQRGGNLGVLTPVFLLFAALFANNPTFMKVLTVLQALFDGSQTGGNKRLNQMGGGKIEDALDGLRGTIKADTTLTDDRKTELIGCIDTLQSNGGISDADIRQIGDTPQTGGRWGLSMPSSLTALKDKGAAAAAAAKDTFTTSFQAAQTAMGELKDDRMAKFMDNIKNQIETVKSKIVNKVSIMKDPNKQQCMKSILSYGFNLIKDKLSSGISVENITKGMAVQVELAKKKSAHFIVKFNGRSSPISTPTPDLGNVGGIQAPIQPTDEENKAALIAANIEANKSYDAAVEVKNAAKSKVTYNNQNGIQNQAAENALKEAQTATSTAYDVALNAAKAAIAGGVPENEVTIPTVRP